MSQRFELHLPQTILAITLILPGVVFILTQGGDLWFTTHDSVEILIDNLLVYEAFSKK